MSNHMPGYQSFYKGFLHHFVMAKLATSSYGVDMAHDVKTNSKASLMEENNLNMY